MLSADDYVKCGHVALSLDHRGEAAEMFLSAVRADTDCEGAWRGLASVLVRPGERAYCLAKALLLNPEQGPVKTEIEALLQQADIAWPSILDTLGTRTTWPSHVWASIGATPPSTKLYVAPARIPPPVPAYHAPPRKVSRREQRGQVQMLAFLAVAAVLIVALLGSLRQGPPPPTDWSKIPTARPVQQRVLTGATCMDGTHSSSTGSGTCSHHGGVGGYTSK